MELGKDHFHPAQTGLGLGVHGDSPAVVVDFHRTVRVENNGNTLSVAGKRFVNRVVDDFPQAMHQSTGVRGPDVHAGTFPDRLQPFKY